MLKERGQVVAKLKLEEGTSKAGKSWEKQDFVIKTIEDKFPKTICFTLFGEKKDLISRIDVDEVVDVQFTVESREFNGKWYHNLNAYAVDVVLDADITKKQQNNSKKYEEEGDDILPF